MKTRFTILFTLVNLCVCLGQSKIKNEMGTKISGRVVGIEHTKNNCYTAEIENSGILKTYKVLIDSTNLKHPTSFTFFKIGDKVAIVGKYTSTKSSNLNMTAWEFEFIQTDREFETNCQTPLEKDSVKLENIVEFKNNNNIPSIRFTLRITNLSNRYIPALNASNNGVTFNKETGEDSITMFYFNNESRGMGIYNGIAIERTTLNNGGVSEISEEFSLINKWMGDIVEIHWKYMGILSEKVKVDLKKRMIIKQN